MCSKLMEKVVHQQLVDHLLVSQLVSDNQFGFLPNRSTGDATFELVNEMYMARNKGEVVATVFLDMRKAFDTVNHLCLLHKLDAMGSSQNSLDWFRNYLTGRVQRTTVNNTTSDPLEITCGVPQGSVLGPLLFAAYINDIEKIVEHGKLILYADDIALVVRANSVDRITALLQSDLDRISQWCKSNKLTVNCDKSFIMWSHSKNVTPDLSNCNIMMDGSTLKRVKEFNYLGVVVDRHLTFIPHVRKMRAIAQLRLSQLRRIRKYLNSEYTYSIYRTMITPILDYGSMVMDGSSPAWLRKLQTIQNHALRLCELIINPQDVNVDDLHVAYGAKKLEVRRKEQLLCTMYKRAQIRDNIVPHNRELRGANKVKLKVPFPHKDSYLKSPLYRGMLAWDELNAEQQNAISRDSFLNKITKQ